VRILLDTHVWLWWLSEPENLPPRIRGAIEEGSNEILISVASSWEIAIKYALGKLPLPESPETFVPSRLQREEFRTLHIEHRHALAVASLPPHHRDPFDRLLIAQGQAESIPIATVDSIFQQYDVALI
jgi:PIN domain nuclease of toxin-antitoxin system